MKKIIVICVIALFILVGFQPAFANDINIGKEEEQLGNKFSVTTNPEFPRDVTFSKTFGRILMEDKGQSVQQTTDGGYIIVGYTSIILYTLMIYRVWLIKTDSAGNKLWDKTFGRSYYDMGSCVQQTTDGGYIITGHKDFDYWYGFGDVWLIKTGKHGNVRNKAVSSNMLLQRLLERLPLLQRLLDILRWNIN